MTDRSETIPDAAALLEAVCEKYHVTLEEFYSPRRFSRYVQARAEFASTLYASGWYSLKELAELMGCSPSTIRYWVKIR